MKIRITFFTILFLAFFMNCSESPIEPEPVDPLDWVSALYYMRGPKTTSGIECFNCIVEEKDPYTNITSFSFKIKNVPGKPDTIRFYGLEGADAGEIGKMVFPGCSAPDECRIYGKMTSPEHFEIDVENNGRRFVANGVIRTVNFELFGQYSDENITIDYDLAGERVNLGMDFFICSGSSLDC